MDRPEIEKSCFGLYLVSRCLRTERVHLSPRKKNPCFAQFCQNSSQHEQSLGYSQNSFLLRHSSSSSFNSPFLSFFHMQIFRSPDTSSCFPFSSYPRHSEHAPALLPCLMGGGFSPSPSPPTAASLSIRILNDRAILFPPSFEIFSGIYLLVAHFQERQ